MQIKLSDESSSILDIYSINQLFSVESDNSLLTITIRKPNQDFEYYKNIFTNEAVKTIEVIDKRKEQLAVFHGQQVQEITNIMQNEETSMLIQIAC